MSELCGQKLCIIKDSEKNEFCRPPCIFLPSTTSHKTYLKEFKQPCTQLTWYSGPHESMKLLQKKQQSTAGSWQISELGPKRVRNRG